MGDTLAHPATAYDRRGLIPRDEGNVWYTPMYFRDVWHWRRVWAQVDMMCSAEKPQGAEVVTTQKPRTRPKKAQPAASENEYGQLTLF